MNSSDSLFTAIWFFVSVALLIAAKFLDVEYCVTVTVQKQLNIHDNVQLHWHVYRVLASLFRSFGVALLVLSKRFDCFSLGELFNAFAECAVRTPHTIQVKSCIARVLLCLFKTLKEHIFMPCLKIKST